jgi:hypothetical protein
MRVSNIVYPQPRPAALGQYGPYQTTYNAYREAAFKFTDEEGYRLSPAGRKFPYQISDVVSVEGSPLVPGPTTGTASSEDGGLVRIPLQIPQGTNNVLIGSQPVNATLSLWKIYNGIQYPIFQNRRLLFTVAPASPLPLDLEAIYASYEADAYAAETARLDAEMAEQYATMVRTEEAEAAKAAAAQKAAAAAADAAAKKRAAQEAVEAAVNAEAVRNKKVLLTVGGVAALGLLAYLAFK